MYNGHCYYFQAEQNLVSWDQAQYDCQREGAHLAYLHSNEEVTWVAERARNTWGEGSTWIGLRRDFYTGTVNIFLHNCEFQTDAQIKNNLLT